MGCMLTECGQQSELFGDIVPALEENIGEKKLGKRKIIFYSTTRYKKNILKIAIRYNTRQGIL